MRMFIFLIGLLLACGDDSASFDAGGSLDGGADADNADAGNDAGPPEPVLATWSTATSPPGEAIAYPNVVAFAGRIWIVGGRTLNVGSVPGRPVRAVHAYDPATDSWETRADIPWDVDLPNVAATEDRLWILGAKGYRGLFSYDPVADEWMAEGERPAAMGIGAAATAVVGTRIYVVGGVIPSSTNPRGARITDFAVFDTSTRTWEDLPPIPEESGYFGADVVGDVLYTSGGSTETGKVARPGQTFAFDLTARAWSERALVPTPVSSFAHAMVGNRIYVLGGVTGSSGRINHEVQVYDVATDSWSTTTAMPTPRFSAGAAALDDRIYVAGGVMQISETEFAATMAVEVLGL